LFANRRFVFFALASGLFATSPERTSWDQLAMSDGPGKWQFSFGTVPKHHALVLGSISIQTPNLSMKANCQLLAAGQIHNFRLGTEKTIPAYVIPGPAKIALACRPDAPVIGKASAIVTGQLVNFSDRDHRWKNRKGETVAAR
jgi:hypothetical protein